MTSSHRAGPTRELSSDVLRRVLWLLLPVSGIWPLIRRGTASVGFCQEQRQKRRMLPGTVTEIVRNSGKEPQATVQNQQAALSTTLASYIGYRSTTQRIYKWYASLLIRSCPITENAEVSLIQRQMNQNFQSDILTIVSYAIPGRDSALVEAHCFGGDR
jgi:hypothetical protein